MVPMAGKLRLALPGAISSLLLIASCGNGSAPLAATSSPTIAITVDGKTQSIEPGTTFAQLVASLGLKAKDGRVLSVQGEVLTRHADPGRILLDGSTAKRRTVLEAGDAVTVQDGRDKIEPSTRKTSTLPGRGVADPQFSLST